MRHDRIPRSAEDFFNTFEKRLDTLERAKRPPSTAGTGTVDSVVPGTGITVDDTDPANPVVSATGGGGGGGGTVDSVTAGDGTITVGGTATDPTISVDTISESQVTGLTSDLSSKVPTTRTVSAGTGLTGGGDLSANRSLAADFGTGGGKVTQGNDSRLSDARTPTAHAASHAAAGSDAITITESQVTGLTTDLGAKLVKASNLSDLGSTATARTNLGLGTSAVVDVPASGNASTSQVVKGDDTRLSDSRTPTTHASTHAAAGSDPVTIDDSQVSPVAPNSQTGTTYTFVLADKHRLVLMSNASSITATIPPSSSVAYAVGTTLQWAQQGVGQITVAAGAGVTIRTPHGAKTAAQYSIAAATKVDTNEWYISGDTTT